MMLVHNAVRHSWSCHEIGYAPKADAEVTFLDDCDDYNDNSETMSTGTSMSQRSSVVTADSGRASSQSTIKSSSKVEEKKKNKKMVVCRIALLDGTQFEPAGVDKNCTGQSVYEKITQHLDVIETDYFGLTYRDKTGKKYWLDHTKKVSKQLNGGTWVFEFQVKFYPPDPMSLKEDITKYQLCLQLRVDIFNGRLPCSFVTCALLGSYTVQAELGDWEPPGNNQPTAYLNDFDFSPVQTQELLDKICELHKQHKGQTPEVAEAHFLENSKKLAMYGVDLHDTKDSENKDIQLGICASGILVYKDRLRINRFVWPKILKLSYKRNHFHIKVRPGEFDPHERTIGFKCETHKLAKRLWKVCVEHHAFFRLKDADAPPSNTMFPRFNTKFRYSGRTAAQARKAAEMSEREEPHITRTAERKSMNLGPNKSKSLDEIERKKLNDEKDKKDEMADKDAQMNYNPYATTMDQDGKYMKAPGEDSKDKTDEMDQYQATETSDEPDPMLMEQKPKAVPTWALPGMKEMMIKFNQNDKLKEDYTQLLRETPDIASTSKLDDVKHKLGHDPRYKAVPTDALREEWFQDYTNDMMKNNYMRLLRETPQIHSQSTWPDARLEIDLDSRFQAVPLEALREEWFNEYVQGLVKSEFMQLLNETPCVHSQSRWDRVKDDIEDDNRYKAVKTDAQRKAWFDEYIDNLKKEEFMQLLRETDDITSYSRYNDAKEDLCNEPRFQNVDTEAQREEYFKEFVQDLKKAGFVQLLRDTPDITAYSTWQQSKPLIDTDPRYHAVDTDLQRAKWFNEYVNDLAGVGNGAYGQRVADYKSIDRKLEFLPLIEPSVTVRKTTEDTKPMPFFEPAGDNENTRKKPPPIPKKPRGHSEVFESEDDRQLRTSVSSAVPVTVETETYKFNPDLDDTPRSTSNIPIVETKTHKVTYEKDGIPYETEDSILVSAHSVTTKSQTIDTTTYKTERDGVVETRVERKVTVTSDGDDELDHDALLRAAILEVTKMNQGLEVEKIECVKQIEEVN